MPPGPSHVTISVATGITSVLGRQGRLLLSRAVPPHLLDDRFDSWADDPAGHPPGFCATLACDADPAAGAPGDHEHELVGFLGGGVNRGRLQLDGVLDPTVDDADQVADRLLAALQPALNGTVADRLEVWGRPAQPWHEALADRHGLAPVRALHQMRCPLPAPGVGPLPSRPYQPGDLEKLVSVNNRAFVHHPDQGAKTAADLEAAMAEPWFRPECLRIHERDGRIAGFCWTKIHEHAAPERRLGEIYVIGVDPDFHGQGLGAPMTMAGLEWLHGEGLTTGMLYVEADNEPAVRTYNRLGFTVVRTDRAWGRTLSGAS